MSVIEGYDWAERVETFDDQGLDDAMRAEWDRHFYDSRHLRRLRDRRKKGRVTRGKAGGALGRWVNKPHRARWRAIRRMAELFYQRQPPGPRPGYFTAARSTWGEGPWQGEPDRIVWTAESKLRCVMRRSPTGNWNGYVAVPLGHPAHRMHYDAVDVQAHGGLTYGSPNWAFHTQGAGARRAWWFGFDCAHYMDQMPALEALTRELPMYKGVNAEMAQALRQHRSMMGTYRTAEAVRLMTEDLAEQLDRLGSLAATVDAAMERVAEATP